VVEHEAAEEESIYLLKDRANIACDGGNYAEARELFELLKERSPEPLRTPLLHKYGVCLARSGERLDALRIFNQAIKEGRDSLYDILSGLEKASILLEQGKREEALATLRTVRKRGPKTFKDYSARKEYSRLRDLLARLD
ncbi:tetratricopeptide repeat protein, partial [Candidatus Aerophobetes bacterium]